MMCEPLSPIPLADQVLTLAAERDELRAEVERLKTLKKKNRERISLLVDAIEERERLLAAARDGSLQAVFDAVVRYAAQTLRDGQPAVEEMLYMQSIINAITAENPSAKLQIIAGFNQLATDVLDELWPPEPSGE